MKSCIITLLLVGAAACSSPTAPSTKAQAPSTPLGEGPPPLLHHNVPATDEQGRIVYLCSTQPREYVTRGGQVYLERDHYVQRGECPATPVP